MAGLTLQGSGVSSRGRGICNQPTQSLSSTWDLGILGWKSEATNQGGKKGAIYIQGYFRDAPFPWGFSMFFSNVAVSTPLEQAAQLL